MSKKEMKNLLLFCTVIFTWIGVVLAYGNLRDSVRELQNQKELKEQRAINYTCENGMITHKDNGLLLVTVDNIVTIAQCDERE